MPLIKLNKIGKKAYWCLWEITETEDEIRNKVYLSSEGKSELERVGHLTKRKERLAARACIQELAEAMSIPYNGIFKDDHNKPHLIGHKHQISISHSYPFAVGIIHKQLPVGIDIEKPTDKLIRLGYRFLNKDELQNAGADSKKLCVYWTGKEAIYKLNGKRGLIFKQDIRIYPFQLSKRDTIRCEFSLNNNKVRLSLEYRELKNHIISYCF